MSAEAHYRADDLFDLYRVIWRVTSRQQLLLIGLSIVIAAPAAAGHATTIGADAGHMVLTTLKRGKILHPHSGCERRDSRSGRAHA